MKGEGWRKPEKDSQEKCAGGHCGRKFFTLPPPTQSETCRDVQDGGLLLGRRRCEAARRNGSLRGIGERD